MKLALAQINPLVGDLEGNVARCLAAIDAARRRGADLVILPEMAVPGCPPRDILLDPTFGEAAVDAISDLAAQTRGGPPVLVGSLAPAGHPISSVGFSPAPSPPPFHPALYNAAILLSDGRAHLAAAKRLLPAHDVYHEPRWFLPGPALPPISIAGRRLGLLLGHDLWDDDESPAGGIHPAADLLAAGADLLVCLAASPYGQHVPAQRIDRARALHAPLACANLIGGQDELIFDGHSFCLNGRGDVLAQLAGFEEEVRVVDLDAGPGLPPAVEHPEHELFRALVLGVRDFARKNRLERAFVGLSGGIDSAVVAALAAESLGPGRVTAIASPSRYTDPRSTASARELAEALGIHFQVIPLEPMHAAAEAALGELIEGGTGAENVQARLRAMVMMAFVNRYGGMVLNTSNKTELAVGYSTLYGDMIGTLSPIGDLTKLEVIGLARWIKATRGLIPDFTLERPPSAELNPGQVDPFDYADIAPRLERLVRANQSDPALRRSEHKRWQMGVILKVSEKAFGTGRLIPITRR